MKSWLAVLFQVLLGGSYRQFHWGLFTESGSIGDIHKFANGLIKACERPCVKIINELEILSVAAGG